MRSAAAQKWAAAFNRHMKIQFKLQTPEEGKQFFDRDMQRDFPADEIKPWFVIEEMMKQGIYELLGAWCGDVQVGYAWMFVPAGEAVLLDYLAVLPEHRGNGVGTAILQALHQRYPDKLLILESEYPEDAPEPDVARRRLGFYHRVGMVNTGVEVILFGVHFCILTYGEDPKAREHMESLYHAMFPDQRYEQAVQFL